jgi:hypothetical protein
MHHVRVLFHRSSIWSPSELFERGLRRINGGQEVTGDGHSQEKIRNNFMAFVGKATRAAVRGP